VIFDNPLAVVPWRPVNDGVMGGVSSSAFRHDCGQTGWAVLLETQADRSAAGLNFISSNFPRLARLPT
jgi:hypothetical protein